MILHQFKVTRLGGKPFTFSAPTYGSVFNCYPDAVAVVIEWHRSETPYGEADYSIQLPIEKGS